MHDAPYILYSTKNMLHVSGLNVLPVYSFKGSPRHNSHIEKKINAPCLMPYLCIPVILCCDEGSRFLSTISYLVHLTCSSDLCVRATLLKGFL